MERRNAMCAPLRLLLFSGILGVTVIVWAADPLLAAYQSPATAVEDPLLGTWVLNVAKSTFSPGPAPKSQRRTYEAHPKGVKATIGTVYADGHSTSIEYVADYDGVEYPVAGSPDADAIVLKKIDAYTAEATLTHAGNAMATVRRVISKDGKTMTITYKGISQGGLGTNVAVYAKQEK
jgi:hypothetical protein